MAGSVRGRPRWCEEHIFQGHVTTEKGLPPFLIVRGLYRNFAAGIAQGDN